MALGRTQLALERSGVHRCWHIGELLNREGSRSPCSLLFGGSKQKGMSALVEDFKQRSFGLTRLWAQRCGEITG